MLQLLKQPFAVEIREVAPRSHFEILPHLRAQTFSTPHTRESLALSLEDEVALRSSILRTRAHGSLGQFAEGVDLFMMECSFRRNKPV